MISGKSLFFGLISLSIVLAAAYEFVLVHELKRFKQECGLDLRVATTIAGGCLAGSFLLNFVWLGARADKRSSLVRAALFLWTAIITIGVVAAGAVLGQIQLHSTLCPAFTTEYSINALQYVSIALLVFSIATPHALKKNNDVVGASAANGNPVSNELKKPLVFI